ncbi:ATP-dependent DNA ligase [Enhygromyxa salina]|uniref:DNA ligase (ATP) n=1 Tax=Enhygromyxa salina TaxID=215803 RepID=A0A0C2D742_9BACT|nr:DNA ligase D [Enhygromyxa salina]KIG18996.1 ATP-dependent DNA ligase [Enhygromyxa salina]
MAKLDAYRRKRNFDATPEPAPDSPDEPLAAPERIYVIQRHDARRLHYDLRLEHGGVLWSWAVPKGPSLDPHQRRLAVQTEDHPLDYANFEGTIPAGQYGGGTVLVWDRGVWIPDGDPAQDFERGRLRFTLSGAKLHGRWNLIRTRDAKTWLLIKSRDEFARPEGAAEIVDEQPLSALSGRTTEQVAAGVERGDTRDLDGTRDQIRDQIRDEIRAIGERAPPPLVLTPQLAVPAEQAPKGPEWLHEIKLDGYRIMARTFDGEVRLRTRGGEDWTTRLPSLAHELANPIFADSLLDGELCALGPRGETQFELLQQALVNGRDQRLVYYLFDLPFAAGHDLRGVPLIERKRILRALLEGAHAGRCLRFSDHVRGGGPEVFARACELGAEGVVSKRISSRYEGRRSHAWRKVKCAHRLTVTVGGFTEPQGLRRYFGALLVGSYDAAGRLQYRGKVGAGYDEASLAQIHARLDPLRQDQAPFINPPIGNEARGVTWVAPRLAIDVQYSDLTEAGRIRHGRFERLHQPEPEPEPMPQPQPQPKSAVRLTHPDKLLYPELGLSKRDVADYIMRVAEWMLPHVRDRPLTLVRCPKGVGASCFYQQHATGLPDTITRVRVRDSDGAEVIHASVSDALGLVTLVQMSVLELHVWGSRVDRLEHPDRLVFDLDPDAELEFARVVDAAVEVRDRLAKLGLTAFVKTTGGKGLHVVAPVERDHDVDRVKAFCRALAGRLAADAPERFTASPLKVERRGKIFVDYLRNGRGATSIAAYSPRANAKALISTPLAWEELTDTLRPEQFALTGVPTRLASLDDDPWGPMASLRQRLTRAAFEAVGLGE